MHDLKPKLFSVMKTYTKDQLVKDIIAGIIVAIIALPLSIALAIASGVSPEKGLYTAIIAGFCISFFGGSRVQIGGPTAAFVVIIYGIIAKYDVSGLVVATIMAGIIMIIFGLCRAGNLIKYIPYTITTGFTAGIAVSIAVGQLKDFLGIEMGALPSEFIEKVIALAKNISHWNVIAFLVGAAALLIQIFWPKLMGLLPDKLKYIKIIPGSIIAIIAATAAVKLLKLPVNTIGDLYTVSSKLPTITIPSVNFEMIKELISPAFTIAILASIESLLSAVVADGMIGSKHRSNAELIGQGIGNIFSGLFGGIPATGAIARTAANIKNGGRTPIAGMVHSLTLLVVLLLLMPYASWIPMPVLASILIMVAYNMAGIKNCVRLCKKAPKSDIIVFALTFFLTVFFDLVIAIEISMVVAAALFLKRMAETTAVESWKYVTPDEENDPDNIGLKKVPDKTLVYEISGPMFFAVTDKFMRLMDDTSEDVLILRMRSVPAIDASALHELFDIVEKCRKNNITLIFSHVNEQPMKMMQKAGFDKEVGLENFCSNIDTALKRAETIVNNNK
ncbi:MAG: SulP family inorganic anion transporter [Butyrivibrio sp.]